MSIIKDNKFRLGCSLSELQKTIDFHDSIIEEISYDKHSLRLYIKIGLCNWRQRGYDESTDNETETIYLRFEGALYKGENRVFNDDDCDGGIYFARMNDENEIEFMAEDKETAVKSYIISASKAYIDLTRPVTADKYNGVIAESENYIVIREYEMCYLYFKNGKYRRVIIGDIYGDADTAIIDRNERFVLMTGFDTIVYYLKEPFEDYSPAKSSEQWKLLELSGDGDFCNELIQISDDRFIARYENGYEDTII